MKNISVDSFGQIFDAIPKIFLIEIERFKKLIFHSSDVSVLTNCTALNRLHTLESPILHLQLWPATLNLSITIRILLSRRNIQTRK